VPTESAIVIGLTGGIASGKSWVARRLRTRGAIVIDADQVARDVVAPGEPALAAIVTEFGATILRPDGTLDRARLGERVFADPDARRRLEAITHPAIIARARAQVAAAAAAGARVVFYEAALLVETGSHRSTDAVIVVAASPATQRRRIIARDGLTEAQAEARLGAQAPLADKLALATWVLHNDGTDDYAFERAFEAMVADIEARFGPIAAPNASAGAPVPRRPMLLVTGFPAFTARRLVRQVLLDEPETRVHVLVQPRFVADADAFLRTLDAGVRDRVTLLEGDVCDIDLGLATGEYAALRRDLTSIAHLASIYFTGVDDSTARRINVVGTRHVLDLAADASRVDRLLHWSTARVAGRRRGEVREEELTHTAGFHNHYEATKYDAERLARAAMGRVPVTVVRPSTIVGDSVTGEIDRLDGPYYLMVLIATNSSRFALPLPGQGNAPLHVVPIDYVITAARALLRDERAAGRTIHLVDPAPLPARQVFELVAQIAGTEPPRAFAPGVVGRLLLRAPGLARVARSQLAFLDIFEQEVTYAARAARELLVPRGIVCPSLPTYLPALVEHVLASRRPGLEATPAASA
jgi:dephospho-CoA kinase